MIAYLLLGQSSGSKVIDTINKTTFCHLIKCTHEILELKIITGNIFESIMGLYLHINQQAVV